MLHLGVWKGALSGCLRNSLRIGLCVCLCMCVSAGLPGRHTKPLYIHVAAKCSLENNHTLTHTHTDTHTPRAPEASRRPGVCVYVCVHATVKRGSVQELWKQFRSTVCTQTHQHRKKKKLESVLTGHVLSDISNNYSEMWCKTMFQRSKASIVKMLSRVTVLHRHTTATRRWSGHRMQNFIKENFMGVKNKCPKFTLYITWFQHLTKHLM